MKKEKDKKGGEFLACFLILSHDVLLLMLLLLLMLWGLKVMKMEDLGV